jgi:spore coat polysaccharide biosynthesis protein SpsF
LDAYLSSRGIDVFRGPLDAVLERFRQALQRWPSQWVLRLSADSPLLDAAVIQAVAEHPQRERYDLITTIFPRTFPRGRNAELIRSSVLENMPPSGISPEDQEHVTPLFYRHPNRFRILNVDSGSPQWASRSLAVDSVEDLARLEALTQEDLAACAWRAPSPAAVR